MRRKTLENASFKLDQLADEVERLHCRVTTLVKHVFNNSLYYVGIRGSLDAMGHVPGASCRCRRWEVCPTKMLV